MSLYQGNSKQENCFLVEGSKVFQSMLGKLKPLKILVPASAADQLMEAEFQNLPCEVVDNVLWKKLSVHDSPPQLLGIFPRPNNPLSSLDKSADLLVLDRIQDPGNMGTLIRTAVASGWVNIICLKGCVDPFSPKVVRASSGALCEVQLFTDITQDDLDRAIEGHGFSTLLTSSHAELELKDLQLENLAKKCLVLGNEGSGIDASWQMKDSVKIKIPMTKSQSVESLNVAIAGALIMYKLKGLL